MSVAIRTATRVQDQDDVNVTVGAGVDGYALTWDNGAGEFVLAAAGGGGVTDHGALSGLSDDDHAQYLLATGARTGASSQAQTFSSGIVGPSWKPASNSTTALQLQNAAGTSVLNIDTTNGRVGIWTTTPGSMLDVSGTAHFLVASGRGTAFETPAAGYGTSFTTYGASDGYAFASIVLADARDLSLTATKSWGIVYRAASDMLRFQYNSAADAPGTQLCPLLIDKTGKVSLGNWKSADADAFAPLTTLHVLTTDGASSIISNIATIDHKTYTTPASGFGGGLAFNLQSSTTDSQSAAQIAASWIVATHASRKARLALSAYDYNGAREGVRIDTDGSAALLGFYGHAATGQQTLATGAGATADDIITALQALGLVKQS